MIIYHPNGSESARNIAALLNVPAISGRRFSALSSRPRKAINYGYAGTLPRIPILNHQNAVSKCTNKWLAIRILEAVGIPTLTLARTQVEVVWWQPGNPEPQLLGRKEHHYGGADILFGKESEFATDTPDYQFYYYVPGDKEYRIHVFGREIISAQRKLPGPNAHPLIRTHSNGWKFKSFTPRNLSSRLYGNSIAAVACFGLDFGAVDVILGRGGEYIVLEVNAAPRLQEPTLSQYVYHMSRWLANED